MPRRYSEPRVRREFYMSQSTALKLDLFCFDPVAGRPKFRLVSEILEGLICEFLDKQTNTAHNVDAARDVDAARTVGETESADANIEQR